jgi:hypothetical protein
MGIGDFFRRWKKGLSKEDPPETQDPSQAPPVPGRKRPMGLKLPVWAKKDNAFVRPGMGMMKPPKDMAEEASFLRPGAWLKNKLGGTPDDQALENLEKTKENRGIAQKMSDAELQEIFQGLLDPEEGVSEVPKEGLVNKKE